MKYDKEILKVLHEHSVDLYKVGAISETRMREYDEMCLKNPKSKKKPASVYKEEKSVIVEHISPVSA
ncbi:MAG: hypothetical protein FWD13_11660 [Treponema sp.]|nr:hypothetical protein [Treponema sp.]